LSDLVTTPFFSFVGAGHHIVDNGAYPVGLSPTVKPPKPRQFVNGHEVLPSGGREISPYTVMSSAPPAAMRFPQSRRVRMDV